MFQKCKEWHGCLSSDQKTKLKIVMRAAGVQSDTGYMEIMGATSGNQSRQISDSGKCVDPRISDPESWECECIDEWTEECGGDDSDDLESCIRQKMCKAPPSAVCPAWKDEFCSSMLTEAEPEMKMALSDGGKHASIRSEMKKRTEASGKGDEATGSDFESTLTGKCTSETQ
jgi:hypothetical protein